MADHSRLVTLDSDEGAMIKALMVGDVRREDDVLFLTIDAPRAIAEACTPSWRIRAEIVVAAPLPLASNVGSAPTLATRAPPWQLTLRPPARAPTGTFDCDSRSMDDSG